MNPLILDFSFLQAIDDKTRISRNNQIIHFPPESPP